jgi:SAM-dependent methyltransferase
MWQQMQANGYFHAHADYRAADAESGDDALLWPVAEPDALFQALDFAQDEVVFPRPYGVALERSIKQNEPHWLPCLFALPQSGSALDLGCGYGRSIDWLRERFDSVIGIEIADEPLAIARGRFRDDPRVRLLTAPGDRLPTAVAPASLDFAYCFTVFQHIPRRFVRRYLRDLARALKPDGRVVFNLLSAPAERPDQRPYGAEWVMFYSPDQARALLAEAGLAPVRLCRWRAQGLDDLSWLWVCAEPASTPQRRRWWAR